MIAANDDLIVKMQCRAIYLSLYLYKFSKKKAKCIKQNVNEFQIKLRQSARINSYLCFLYGCRINLAIFESDYFHKLVTIMIWSPVLSCFYYYYIVHLQKFVYTAEVQNRVHL